MDREEKILIRNKMMQQFDCFHHLDSQHSGWMMCERLSTVKGVPRLPTGVSSVYRIRQTEVCRTFLHLMALVFGIIGWASKKTKNLFPVAGVILNGFFLLAGIFLVFFILTNLKFPG